MRRTLKSVSSLATLAAATGMLTLTACGGEGGEGESAEGEGVPASDHSITRSTEGEGEGEGGEGASEGEGAEGTGVGAESEGGEGESEGARSAGAALDNVSLLTQLGLMRGHLYAFYELHKAEELENAATHAKHPESELYAGIEPALTARGIEGFSSALTTLADAAVSGGDIDAAYMAVQAAIIRAEKEIGANNKEKLLSLSFLVRVAADEYKIGVAVDGSISNLHEYQDAFGFIVVAQEILSSIQPAGSIEEEAIQEIDGILISLNAAFDGLTPAKAPGQASTLYGAAARIEIAARGI